MISDDEIRNLPDDPNLAFAKYVSLLRDAANIHPTGNVSLTDRKYIANIVAAIEFYGIDFNLDVNDIGADFWGFYNDLETTLEVHLTKIRLEGLRDEHSINHNFIELSDDYRSQIHNHLNKVRKIVNAVDIEERLRENIFRKLNALSAEIDKGRSGLARFTDAYIEVAAAVAEGAEKLEPAIKQFERIGGIFGKARKENDVKRIARGEEPKLIAGPDTVDSDGDDEMPF